MKDADSKYIAILTNMVTPYRVPFFREMAKHNKVRKLDVLVCVEREVDRQWQVENDAAYNIVKLAGITLNLRKRKDAMRILHFRYGVVGYLLINRPDRLIIGDASWTSYMAAFLCRLLSIEYVVWNEITTTSKVSNGIVSKLRRWVYKGARHCIASCSMAKDFLIENGVQHDRITIINNAVDNDFFLDQKKKWSASRQTIRDELGVHEDSFCFIYVGQLISRKKVIETVELLARASSEKKIHLIVAGCGPLEDEMRDTANKLGFKNITFCGFVSAERLCQLYTASDALILLSEDEPWGMVINEALLMGKPFLASPNVAAAIEILGKTSLDSLQNSETFNGSIYAGDIRDVKKFIQTKWEIKFEITPVQMALQFVKLLYEI